MEPGDEIQKVLLQLWRDVLKRQDIGIDDDFFLSGGDSLAALELLYRIEERLKHRLPLAVLVGAPSVRQLEALLKIEAAEQISNTVGVHTAGSARPLFALHGMFGNAVSMLPILRLLSPDQPGYALQPPGMGWPDSTTLPQAAEYWIGEIKTIQPRGPYRLLGTSFGGLAMFEAALQLQDMGETIEYLAMVDTKPPTCRFDDHLDVRKAREVITIDNRHELHRRAGEMHLHMVNQYQLDSRKPFRGELVYVCCTGNPVIAGHDRRELWRHFATEFRLHHLPSQHDVAQLGLCLSAFAELLSVSLNDRPPAGINPADVYERTYRIGSGTQQGTIIGSMGDVYRINQDRTQGVVDTVRIDVETIQVVGWAVEPDQRPAPIIAVFVDDQFLGYGAAAKPRPDVAQHLGSSTPYYSGFDFIFPKDATDIVSNECRVFVLSQDGCATRLRSTFVP